MSRSIDLTISAVISSVIKRAQAHRRTDELERLWKRVCGKRFAVHSCVGSYRQGVLVVYVDRSEWLYEMHGRRDDWLSRLRQYPAGCNVTQIVFRIGQS